MKRWLELSPLYQTAARTGSKLYPSNMQRMLIKDLIQAVFLVYRETRASERRALWAGSRGRGGVYNKEELS